MRAHRRSLRERGAGSLSVEDAVALVLAIGVLAYLVYALLVPEKLG